MDVKGSYNASRIELIFFEDGMNKIFDDALHKINGMVIIIRHLALCLSNLNVETCSYQIVRLNIKLQQCPISENGKYILGFLGNSVGGLYVALKSIASSCSSNAFELSVESF